MTIKWEGQPKKSRLLAAFFVYPGPGRSDSERFHSLVQTALVTRGFVLRDNALVDHAVDNRYSLFIRRHCGVLIAGITCLDDDLYLGAHHGAQTHVVLAGLLRLACALPG